jgi:hydrogenase maturation protein HypF
LPPLLADRFAAVDPSQREIAETLLHSRRHGVQTSSTGRLFDAVAFLLGLCECNDVEARAAMAVEAAASNAGAVVPYAIAPQRDGERLALPHRELLRAMVADLTAGTPREVVAARFHETLVAFFAEVAVQAVRSGGERIVVLSGGCFLNQILSRRLKQRLAEAGVARVLAHERLSPGDASLALGQVLAATRFVRD